MKLEIGKAYYLEGMRSDLWDAGHPKYGKPERIAGKYLGFLQGVRCWHGFEIYAAGSESGVIFMTDDDLSKLRVSELAS
jgi:hypothetical protein